MTTANDVLKRIKDEDVKFIDLRFTDPRGKMQHLTMDVVCVDEDMCQPASALSFMVKHAARQLRVRSTCTLSCQFRHSMTKCPSSTRPSTT